MIEGIGVVLTALTGLVVAFGGFVQQRQKARHTHSEETDRELERKSRQFRAALRYIGAIGDWAARNGLDLPPEPAELKPDWGLEKKGRGDEPAKAVSS